MVNLVENESFVIIRRVVPHSVHHCKEMNKDNSCNAKQLAGLMCQPNKLLQRRKLEHVVPAEGTSMLTTSILSK